MILVDQEMSRGLGRRARSESWIGYHVEYSKGGKINQISIESHKVLIIQMNQTNRVTNLN